MQDQPNNSDQSPKASEPRARQSLSEISHLFLSSVRERQGAPGTAGPPSRPKRTPPQPQPQSTSADLRAAQRTTSIASDADALTTPGGYPSNSNGAGSAHIDLTPEEFAHVFDELDRLADAPAPDEHSITEDSAVDRVPPVTALIAQHLNGHQRDRAREYAAHLCKSGERVGLIELDACEFRLTCFERGRAEGPQPESRLVAALDGRLMAESLEEMNWDVDRWLLLLPALRGHEARAVLRLIDRWAVLATCDHDGVVSCYRTLKGLGDARQANRSDASTSSQPKALSLALLNASDEATAQRVFRKLSGVCQQFLHWTLENEAPVHAAGSFIETPVLTCRATHDKAQLAAAPQWQVVIDFLLRARQGAAAPTASARTPEPEPVVATVDRASSTVIGNQGNEMKSTQGREIDTTHPHAPRVEAAPAPAAPPAAVPVGENLPEVIDLPAGSDVSPGAIVGATLHGCADMVECPVKPPMLADASLAVARDRRLVLFAVARQGLADLRAVADAYRWMNENRSLIAMAVPQLSIDAHQLPHLRLLVDRADLSAATLQPLLQSGNVTVQTYRKLRWGPRTGLLLEAA